MPRPAPSWEAGKAARRCPHAKERHGWVGSLLALSLNQTKAQKAEPLNSHTACLPASTGQPWRSPSSVTSPALSLVTSAKLTQFHWESSSSRGVGEKLTDEPKMLDFTNMQNHEMSQGCCLNLLAPALVSPKLRFPATLGKSDTASR